MSALEEFDIRAGGCDRYGDTREQKTVNLARAAIAGLEGRLEKAEAMLEEYREWLKTTRGWPVECIKEVLQRDASIAELEAKNKRLRKMLHAAWQRSGQAWNWPEDEWLEMLAVRAEPRCPHGHRYICNTCGFVRANGRTYGTSPP